jgi:hypothetical protein
LSSGLYRPATSNVGFVTAGLERIRIASNGFVGIGTTNPSVLLDVAGDVSANTYNGPGGTAGAPHYTSSEDRTTGIFMPTSGREVAFTSAGTERGRFDLSGLRMINGNIRNLSGTVSAPSYTFFNDLSMGLYDPESNVLGFVTAGTEKMRIDTSGGIVFPTVVGRKIVLWGSTTSNTYFGNEIRAGEFRNTLDASTNSFTFGHGSALSGTGTGFTEVMRVRGDGRVGIGTTTLNQLLSVEGTIGGRSLGNLGTNTEGGFLIDGGSTGAGFYLLKGTNNNFAGISVKTTNTGTATEQVRFNYDGTVGIGTSNPNAKLEIYQGGTGVTSAMRL